MLPKCGSATQLHTGLPDLLLEWRQPVYREECFTILIHLMCLSRQRWVQSFKKPLPEFLLHLKKERDRQISNMSSRQACMCMICLLSDRRNEIKHLEPSVLVVQHGAQGRLDLADTRGEILSDAVHPESDWYLYGHKNPQHAHTSLIKHSFIGNLSSLSSLLSTLSSSVFCSLSRLFAVTPPPCAAFRRSRLDKSVED